jgi:hypothetical protein
MTLTTNSRLAGFMFLFYIANGIAAMILFSRAAAGANAAAKLASIAQHAPLMRIVAILTLLMVVDALVLAVALYGLTRHYDHDLAVLALSFRVVEGVIAAVSTVVILALLYVATHGTTALGALLLETRSYSESVSASAFAIGSTIFCWQFLRARTIPRWLAWLGLTGSILTLASLLLGLACVLHGPVVLVMWIPIFLFEVIFGVWLLVKRVRS